MQNIKGGRILKPIISIVIPVYNVEKYLERCIKSILSQTFEKFELILINDGSKDRSGKICEAYAKKDIRIRVVHKKNEGVSVARNLGIDLSRGEYIGFVDSDDYIENDMYEVLYKLIEENNADLSACGHSTINDKEKKAIYSNEFISCDKKTALKLFAEMKIFRWSCWDKLYKKSSLGEIRFPKISHGEDTIFLLNFFQNNNKFVGVENPKYNYIKINPNSVTSEKFSEKKLDLLIYFKELYAVMYKNNLDSLGEKAEGKYYQVLLSYYSRCGKFKINNYLKHQSEIYQEIKKNYQKIKNNNYINNAVKINIALFIIFPKLVSTINNCYLSYKDCKDG